EALEDLAQDFLRDGRVFLRQLEMPEEGLRVAHGQPAHDVYRPAAHANVARLAAQPRAIALRTREIPAVAAPEHTHWLLVLLALEPAEDPLHAFPRRAVAVDDEAPLLIRELGPRHVEPHALAGDALQLRQLRAVVRLAPRLDRVLKDRFRPIGNDQ